MELTKIFQGETYWVWTGGYAQFTPKASKSPASSKQMADDGLLSVHAVKVPSQLISTANIHSKPISSLPNSSIKTRLLNLKRQTTYLIAEGTFNKTIATDFEKLDPSKFTKLKNMVSSTVVPYNWRSTLHDTTKSLVLGRPTEALANKTLVVDALPCHLCSKNIKPDKVRSHVGEHILFSILGVTELGLKQTLGDLESICGYCRLNVGCKTTILKESNSKTELISRCPHSHKFSFAHAMKPTQTQPSTNVPITCKLCDRDDATGSQPTYWKYSLFAHIKQTHHRNHWNSTQNLPQNLPPYLLERLTVMEEELSWVRARKRLAAAGQSINPVANLPFGPHNHLSTHGTKRGIDTLRSVSSLLSQRQRK
ncbi:hypothetical protein BDN71DRAFT_1505743 [Pleurotus eryngii]|uniref:Uncharacterized protein n=1 Tax=Pleurotus eryngii TaxID=5323 RepID=A0A9P6DHH2_PLEER|nr:hypothetical protein BDN71DRAFT_1505743 [Pleurotus eryngii]